MNIKSIKKGQSSKSPEMQKFINDLSKSLFGRSPSENPEICVTCGKPKGKFKDVLSEKEWNISHMCQKCQDRTFGE